MVSARTVAVVLILVGAAAFAIPTFATEGFNTQRDTSFSLGSEEDSLIGTQETSQRLTHQSKGRRTATAGRLVNNFDSVLSMTYRVRTDTSAVKPDPQRDTVRLRPGGKASITVECGSGNSGSGTATVTAVVESASADGVGVEDAEFDFQIRYDCVPATPEPGEGDGGDGGDGGGGPGDRGVSESLREYCADSAGGEDVDESENENENSGDRYKYSYDYTYDYQNGKYRYEYSYNYEWSENADQNPDPSPDKTPDQSLDCVNDDVDIDLANGLPEDDIEAVRRYWEQALDRLLTEHIPFEDAIEAIDQYLQELAASES
jgi:hypothetical protein